MSFIKNIFVLLKKILKKESNKKMLDRAIVDLQKRDKNIFSNSLKVDIVDIKKNKVETPICNGNGLGIQKKINY